VEAVYEGQKFMDLSFYKLTADLVPQFVESSQKLLRAAQIILQLPKNSSSTKVVSLLRFLLLTL